MGKRKTGAVPVNPPQKPRTLRIDMTKAELAKAYQKEGFRTGVYRTEKDRPRKKNWKKEYDPQKESNGYRNDPFDSFCVK